MRNEFREWSPSCHTPKCVVAYSIHWGNVRSSYQKLSPEWTTPSLCVFGCGAVFFVFFYHLFVSSDSYNRLTHHIHGNGQWWWLWRWHKSTVDKLTTTCDDHHRYMTTHNNSDSVTPVKPVREKKNKNCYDNNVWWLETMIIVTATCIPYAYQKR